MNCLRNHSPHIEGPTGCVYCYMEGLRRDADKQAAITAELLEALQLFIAHHDPQCAIWRHVDEVARTAIAKAKGELK